jgi:Protein of unknown function (DUF3592)
MTSITPDVAVRNVVFFGIGLMLVSIGLQHLLSVLAFRRRARATPGRVIGVETDSDESEPTSDHVYFRARIEFVTTRGVRRKLTEAGWRLSSGLYDTGEQVTVLYDPELPERAEVKTARVWVPALGVTAIGLMIAAITLANSIRM